MPRETQISAPVSPATRAQLEQHVRATGVKKGYLIEQALLYHLRALDELPMDIIMPPRIVVTSKSGAKVLRRLTARPRPTKRLRALLRP